MNKWEPKWAFCLNIVLLSWSCSAALFKDFSQAKIMRPYWWMGLRVGGCYLSGCLTPGDGCVCVWFMAQRVVYGGESDWVRQESLLRWPCAKPFEPLVHKLQMRPENDRTPNLSRKTSHNITFRGKLNIFLPALSLVTDKLWQDFCPLTTDQPIKNTLH